MRAAFALRMVQGRIILNLPIGKICGFSRLAFSRVGSWRKTAFAAPASCGSGGAAGKASACRKHAGTLRWARGREGCSDSPPPYLWTPPTPQQVKDCTPLTILKKKSKHKKASAAPVGAIALTLFRFSIYSPSVATRQLPQGGADTPAALSQKAALQMPFSVTTPPVKMRLERSAERDKREI